MIWQVTKETTTQKSVDRLKYYLIQFMEIFSQDDVEILEYYWKNTSRGIKLYDGLPTKPH